MKKFDTIVDGLCYIFEKNHILQQAEISQLKKNFERSEVDAFEDFLMQEAIVSKEALLEALGEFYTVPFIDVNGVFLEHHLVSMFPKDEMLRNVFVPYMRDGSVMVLIAQNPNNNTLAEIAGRYVSYDITYMVGIARDITDAIEDFFDADLQTQEEDFIPEEVKEKEEDESFDDIVNLE